MSPLATAALMFGSSGCYWCLARHEGRRRGIPVGRFPRAAMLGLAAAIAGSTIDGQVGARAVAGLGGLAVAAFVDARTGLIFARLSRSLGIVVLAWSCSDGTIGEAAAGGCAAVLLLALPYVVTRGRGMGLGDVRLGIAVGATVGMSHVLVALGGACVLGATYGVIRLAAGDGSREPIAFAPFLASGSTLAVLEAAHW